MEAASSPATLSGKLWRNSLLVALANFSFFVVYMYFLDNGFTLSSFTKTFAGTANFLFAMSLSLSSVGYYFNFLDSKIVYRKYLGLLGYFSALAYSLLLLAVNPDRYFYGFFENFWSSDILLGLASMALFTGMALISNDQAMRFIGPLRWRSFLRWAGHTAFFLLVVRAVINNTEPIGVGEPEMWVQYLAHPDGLLPPRLLFSLVAMAVIFLRLSIEFDKWRKHKAPPAPPSSVQPVPPAPSSP